ncbi:MAG TPA: energy transducer TonB [Vicinamibacterales bacterium]|nr:energy transducer TonB [Vicinamibacterales bacterium]
MLTSLVFVMMVAGAEQDSLTAARELYASAAYEDALNVLAKLPENRSAEETRAAEQYRAFCLLALGRTGEAERAIEAVVQSAPTFRPSDSDISPRMKAAFVDVRRRMLPSIIQAKYTNAKTAFDRRQFEAAASGFAEVLTMMSDPDAAQAAAQPPLSDMRTLAVGFHDLSVNAMPPPPLAAADVRAPVATIPKSSTAPAATSAAPPVPAARAAGNSAAAPAAAVPNVTAGKIFSILDSNVVPPFAIRQDLPKYPGDVPIPKVGQIEILINEAGYVESAMIRVSVTAKYDELALNAAREWRYKPATINGMPVKYRKVISVTVKPFGRS